MKTPIIEINNAPRGCGKVKRGGCYGIGTLSKSGTLQPWVWLLGKPVVGQTRAMIYTESIPPRSPVAINPRSTLYAEEVWLAEWPSSDIIPFENIPGEGMLLRMKASKRERSIAFTASGFFIIVSTRSKRSISVF